MALKQTNRSTSNSKETFAKILLLISNRFSLTAVFEDFLTMSIAACTQNPETKKSWYEDEYLETIAKYKDSDLRHEFPKAFAYLINEMEERLEGSLGNDILGDFYEEHISNGRNGQFFTPYPICQFMASAVHSEDSNDITKKPRRILDPACGSGRMLLASLRLNGIGDEYYGIDIDRTCVKMASLNLFFNGAWNSEVMCANSLVPDDFVISYRISLIPLGIFKIEEKEQSRLWNIHKNSFASSQNKSTGSEIILDRKPFTDGKKDNGSQLDLF